MADTLTTNYSLTKPEIGGSNDSWGTKINANLDVLDTTIKAVSNVANAALPAASYTAADVLSKLLTVDGSGSGLDADLLDGQHGAYYADVAGRLGYTPVNKAGDSMTGALNVSGAVGIGTVVPSAKLEVARTDAADGVRVTVGQGAYAGNVALFGVTGQSNGYYITKDAANNIQHMWDGTGGAERMRIDSAGRVGIATNAPWEKLSIPFNEGLAFGSSAYSYKISRSSTGELVTTFSDTYDASTARVDFTMRNGAVTPLVLTGAGNVGVGVIPLTVTKLQVGIASNRRFTVFANGADNTFGYLDDAGNWIDTLVNGNPLRFGVNGTEQARLTTTGLGIGNTPAHKLDVTGSARVSSSIIAENGSLRAVVNVSGGTIANIGTETNHAVNFLTNNSVRAEITAGGVFNYGGIEIGYRDIPRVTGGIERGKCNAVAAGFTVDTGPAAGSAYSVYNDSAAAFTITQGAGLTLRLGGTTTTGNRTLAPRGFATIWFNSTTEAVIQGSGVS